MMLAATEAGVITKGQRFTLHGLKHRGIADTKGVRRRKRLANGHRSEAMVTPYDYDVPVVSPASSEPFGAAK